MDHVGIVVDDRAAATAFFVELGLELERTSSCAVKNVSAVPYDMPRTQRTRKPEATGLTSWFCADRFARKANLDVLPSEARP
jgi:hypothetical protein